MDESTSGTPEKKSRKKLIIKCIAAFLIVAVIVLAIIFGPAFFTILMLNYGGEKYSKFNEKRIAEMEQMFSISISDGIKAEKYEHKLGMFDDGWDILEISGISNYEKFMENNVRGTIDDKTVDGIYTSYKTGDTVPVTNKDMIHYDFYDSENFEIKVDFYPQADGTYTAKLEKNR